MGPLLTFLSVEDAYRHAVEAAREAEREAIQWYAVWEGGQQWVGVMRRPLREVLAETDQRYDRLLADLSERRLFHFAQTGSILLPGELRHG